MQQLKFITMAVAMFFVGQASAQTQFSRALVFGDSLSDNGNLHFPVTAYPPLTLYEATNGQVWAEQLFGPLDNTHTTINPNSANLDLAFGGADTNTASLLHPSTQDQINFFVGAGGVIGPQDVVSLWVGGNNIGNNLNLASTPANMLAVANSAAFDVGNQLNQLATLGAKTIIVPNLPDPSSILLYSGGPLAALADYSGTQLNAAVLSTVQTFSAANPSVNVVYVDQAALYQAVLANPASFGFSNTTQACYLTPSCLSDPTVWNSYFFWDNVHPTAAMHALLAANVAENLNAPSRAVAVMGAMTSRSIDDRRNSVLSAFDELDHQTPEPDDWRYWVSVAGETGQQQGTFSNGVMASSGMTTKKAYDYVSGGLRFGGLFNQGNGLNLGAEVHLLTGKINAQSASKFEVENTQISADMIARWEGNNGLFVDADLGLGAEIFSNYNYSTVGLLKNTGATTGLSASATTKIGYDASFGNLSVTPSARISYLHAGVNGFSESGLLSSVNYGTAAVDELAAAAELKVRYSLAPKTSVYVLGGYESILASNGGRATGQMSTGLGAFDSGIALPASGSWQLGMGVDSTLQNWKLNIDLRAFVDTTSQLSMLGNATLSASF
jgi:outer membrane lipase/esterase